MKPIAQLDALYRQESGRVLASLIRLLGDFDLAEEALQDAFAAAAQQWTDEGTPQNPRAWLISTGRFKAIDRLRRQQREEPLQEECNQLRAAEQEIHPQDELRLLFICCHPALAADAQVALSLREICGLSTEEIAQAYLSSAATIAQRIVRAKRKISQAGIPYEIPPPEELPERLNQVMKVIYLVFNEGHTASHGEQLSQSLLANMGLRLGRQLHMLMPQEAEVGGLLALMLLHDARRSSRQNAEGDLILLGDQDRSLWDHARIKQASQLVEDSLRRGRFGPYCLQAAIAALHAEANSLEETDWPQIIGLYDVLLRIKTNPVIALNRAAAVAMRDGPAEGLKIMLPLLNEPSLKTYQHAYAAVAELYRRLGQNTKARQHYEQALALCQQDVEARYLRRALKSVCN